MHAEFWWRNLLEKGHLEDPKCGRLIFRWIPVRWTELVKDNVQLRFQTSRLCTTRQREREVRYINAPGRATTHRCLYLTKCISYTKLPLVSCSDLLIGIYKIEIVGVSAGACMYIHL
jgi:hypothetical protein